MSDNPAQAENLDNYEWGAVFETQRPNYVRTTRPKTIVWTLHILSVVFSPKGQCSVRIGRSAKKQECTLNSEYQKYYTKPPLVITPPPWEVARSPP